MMRAPLVGILLLFSSLMTGCLGGDDARIGDRSGVIVMPADLAAHPTTWAVTGSTAGGTTAWAGPLDQILDPVVGAGVVAARQAEDGRDVVVLTHPWDLHVRNFTGWDTARAEQHRTDLLTLVNTYKVDRLGLGYEIDLLADDDAETFERFTAWWQETYQELKAASPGVLIFPVFQYERMIGLKGGFYGGANGDPEAWHLLDGFPDRDLTGFTTFPGMIYRGIDHIPSTHYEALETEDIGPVAFAAVGWPSSDPRGARDGDVATQAAFVDWFGQHVPDHLFRLWARLHDDPQARAPYGTMGLLDEEGTPRAALARWQDLSSTV